MMCRSFSYCTGLNAVTKILHKKLSKQEAKPKYYVLMYLSGQRQVILSARFTNYHINFDDVGYLSRHMYL